jgi:hypothetical protein
VGMQINKTIVERTWRFLKKLKKELPYDSVKLLLDIYTKELKSGYNIDTCTPLFITGLFIVA